MPEFLAPGVYIEELDTQPHPIPGVSTSVAGFIGVAHQAYAPAPPISSFAEFERLIGNKAAGHLLLAVRGFFENGGMRCFVALIAATDPLEAGLDALAAEDISIVCCPDENVFSNAPAMMAAHCESRRDRICVLQSAQPAIPEATHDVPVHSSYAAYYYPWITVVGLDGVTLATIPPGGHVAGIYASTDTQRGIWTAPAGVALAGVTGLSSTISAAESDLLASRGINVLRFFSGQGSLVSGARTTSQNPEWKYVNIRRLAIFIEQSLDQGLQWAVFEPNSPALWAAVRLSIDDFLLNIWKSGGLVGTRADEAFFVRCDTATMTQGDIDSGRLVAIVGFAPVRPAEFVILQVICQTNCG
jgi:phage tail sheath protein FI